MAVVLSVGFYLEYALREWLVDRVTDELISHARMGRNQLLNPALPLRAEEMDPMADAIGHAAGARATIVVESGVVVGDSEIPLDKLSQLDNHAGRPEIIRAFADGVGVSQRYSKTLRTNMIYVAARFDRTDGRRGVMRMALPLKTFREISWRLRLTLAVAGLMGLIIAVSVSGLAAHFSTRRFRQLAAHVVQSASTPQRNRLEVRSQDEIGWLAGTFNEMADEVDTALSSLTAERDRLAAVLEGMAEGVVVLDAEHRITLFNPSARDILGLGQMCLHQPVENVLDEDDQAPLLELLESELVGHVELNLERDGQARWILAQLTPTASGHSAILTLHDVSDLRRQEKIRQDFVANVSHELRTPVSILQANAETLVSGAIEDRVYGRKLAEAMERNAARLADIISKLLDLSRIESDGYVIRMEAVNISACVEHVIETLKPIASERSVFFRNRVEAQNYAVGDREAIEEILSNLLGNAVKYIPPGSQVTVLMRPSPPHHWRVMVTDNGPGIDPIHFDRLFERFYRVDKGRAREMGGTGLGLSIVKRLVIKLGGEVGVEGVKPNGVCFWFTLRRLETPAKRSADDVDEELISI
ncbi:putative multi-sensor signal transduction histidine kinase [Magnetofaba australis IT-1]|uniref:histidine kinase n=1 Tax=Magnetofaba australis IT-1 TaxID=1434232 RepID=A0A1Y2K6A3_9PROT|nr:putative multi-sensor signal transduction histidine kinase [Magnetofaba australis IT-1]